MPIVRCCTPYIVISQIGELNEKGKSVMSIGYHGKRVASKEKPLSSLIIPLIKELQEGFIVYRSVEHGKGDLDLLKEFVNDLHIGKNE